MDATCLNKCNSGSVHCDYVCFSQHNPTQSEISMDFWDKKVPLIHSVAHTGKPSYFGLLTPPNSSFPSGSALSSLFCLAAEVQPWDLRSHCPSRSTSPEWGSSSEDNTYLLWPCLSLDKGWSIGHSPCFQGHSITQKNIYIYMIWSVFFNRFCTSFEEVFLIVCSSNITFPMTQVL